MGPTVTFLFSIGLCLNWGIGAQMVTLLRPTLWAEPSPVVSKGANVTLRCQGRLGSHKFQLWRDGELTEERNESRELEEFVLMNVDVERDARNYSCRYGQGNLWSESSEPLEVVVMTGPLPKPTLRPHPGLIVFPGTNITFWCSRPKMSSLKEVEFNLSKTGMGEPLQIQRSAEPWNGFLLSSVSPDDTGSYSCAYRDSTDPARHSESSDALELLVTGSLTRPSLSALPGLVVKPGTNVTLKCWQHTQLSTLRVTFILLKVGTPQPLQTQSPAGTTAEFPLLSVRAEDAGNYSCVYHSRIHPYQVSQPSEVLEIWVTDTGPSNTDVNSFGSTESHSNSRLLVCASFILLLCFLLLMFLCHCSRHMRSLQRANTRRCLCYPCLPWGINMPPNPDAPREDALYTEIAKERPREALVSMAEEPQEVVYTDLNVKTLNKRNKEPMKPCIQPTLYASVSTE